FRGSFPNDLGVAALSGSLDGPGMNVLPEIVRRAFGNHRDPVFRSRLRAGTAGQSQTGDCGQAQTGRAHSGSLQLLPPSSSVCLDQSIASLALGQAAQTNSGEEGNKEQSGPTVVFSFSWSQPSHVWVVESQSHSFLRILPSARLRGEHGAALSPI